MQMRLANQIRLSAVGDWPDWWRIMLPLMERILEQITVIIQITP